MHIKNDVPNEFEYYMQTSALTTMSEMAHGTEMVVGQLHVYSPAFSISIPSVIISTKTFAINMHIVGHRVEWRARVAVQMICYSETMWPIKT